MDARRISTGSDSDSEAPSPVLAGFDSSSALILVHDDEDLESAYDQEPDSPEDDDTSYLRPYIQPLGPFTVFLYLFSPFIKLGAILLPNANMPLKLSLPALLLFAGLSMFVRNIWYLLGRYQRKTELEDIIVDLFSSARTSRSVRERVRKVLRSVVRTGTAILRLLLATIYLREGTHALLPLLPEDIYISNWAFALVLAVVIYPFVIAQSLGSKRVVYATWASIATYVLWFFCVVYAHTHGSLTVNPGWLRMGTLWEGVTTIAFVFTSSSTLNLYASLKASRHAANSAASKTPVSRSFEILSIVSVALAICLTFPLLIFAASPNKSHVDMPSYRLKPFILFLSAITLLLGIPSILITTPSPPIPEYLRRSVTIPLSKTILFIVVVALSLVPVEVSRVYSDILIVCALGATYFLPALAHIISHFFKRPLSIIMPSLPATPSNPSFSANFSSSLPPLPDSSFGPLSSSTTTPNSANDPLLQRKELMLQRKQFGKRIIWDIGVWVLLLPVGGGGFVWAAGRIAGQW